MQPSNGTNNLNPGFDFLSESSLKAYRADRHFSIKISRNTLLAVIFSILLHALLFFVVPQIKFDKPGMAPARAIEVSLAPLTMPTKTDAPQQSAPVVIKPVEPVKKASPKAASTKIISQKLLTAQKPAFSVPETPAPKVKPELDKRPFKEPEVSELPVEKQYADMAAYVKARQAKRQDYEAAAAEINAEAVARERGQTEARLSEDRLKRSLKSGTNGIFEITSLGQRNATFSFRGWTNDYSNSKRQFFEVEATGGQDVRLVMIRRMIALIREHYQGDFNWESRRLGRSVVQSARPEDSAGLEDFLMMEFFGSNYKTTQY